MKDKKTVRLLKAVLILFTVLCLLPVVQSCSLSIRHERQEREWRTLREKGGLEAANKKAEDEIIKGNQDHIAGDSKGETATLTKWKELYAQNSDFIGWLIVEGTKIDYPVVQSRDNEYYLHHNFQKEEDKYGCLYVKDIADVDTPGTNFIIYGHHMKDDSMFGDLDKYESESFFEKHGDISFETLKEERVYKVMAAFRTELSETGDDTEFRYYQFYQADTEEEFFDFYENVKALSIYDTGVTAEYGDTFLTLSTCSSHAENGRFVVVAKRVK